ncbi:unnamed protein product [Symbiodinium natans]|uniref:Transmembrane protein n=1 Tax=Symbiodinium natans TaxID=878477 RepID=A0A812I5T9_9DINO|nr:unnamed protein product [Symbiodinium natans]
MASSSAPAAPLSEATQNSVAAAFNAWKAETFFSAWKERGRQNAVLDAQNLALSLVIKNLQEQRAPPGDDVLAPASSASSATSSSSIWSSTSSSSSSSISSPIQIASSTSSDSSLTSSPSSSSIRSTTSASSTTLASPMELSSLADSSSVSGSGSSAPRAPSAAVGDLEPLELDSCSHAAARREEDPIKAAVAQFEGFFRAGLLLFALSGYILSFALVLRQRRVP